MVRLDYHLHQHLRELAHAYDISIGEDEESFLINGFRLPEGYNGRSCDLLLIIPQDYDYPASPPGIGDSKLYLPSLIRYRGHMLDEFRPQINPGWGNWAWCCFQRIDWDPHRDNLITFFELVRAHLTNPPTL
jgi:hypothetical protein